VRLGLAAPGGRVPTRFARPTQETGAIDISEVAGNGGALEFRAGMTGPLSLGLVERWIGYGFLSGGALAKKDVDLPDAPALAMLRQDGVGVEATPGFLSGGFALGLGQSRDHFGVFAELGVLLHSLSLDYATTAEVPACNAKATATRTGTGTGGRLSAGVGFPIASWGMLAPYLTLSVEQMNSLSFRRDDCFDSWYQDAGVQVPPANEDVPSPVTHTFFGVGIGGEVFLGL
jgi:hypothetical protein